ncbi:hypothetical protein Tco_0027601, partial [Tanacetum coccineum]
MIGLDEYAIRKKIIKSKITNLNTKTSETVGKTNEANTQKPKTVYESVNRDKVIIEDWNSDDEDDVSKMQTVSPVKTNETRTGKMDTDLKKSRWVWRPKGNYLDHVSKDSGSFMLKRLRQSRDLVVRSCSDELKFNLFSVSQMYDKKNSVLFTKTKCLILSPSFKLLDES